MLHLSWDEAELPRLDEREVFPNVELALLVPVTSDDAAAAWKTLLRDREDRRRRTRGEALAGAVG